jgi:hypothetical protein
MHILLQLSLELDTELQTLPYFARASKLDQLPGFRRSDSTVAPGYTHGLPL